MPRGKVIKEGEGLLYGFSDSEWKSLHKSKRWRIKNPEKQYLATKSWCERNPARRKELLRKSQLKLCYGITQEQYLILLEKQNNQCAICNTSTPTGKWKVFAIDHCHSTGTIRGILCNECNRGMGLLRDSSELLRKAADYLDCHKIKTDEEKGERLSNLK